MPYSSGPYDLAVNNPPPAAGSLSSSRGIQFSTGTYVVDEDGGFDPMPSVAQRVCLLVAFASDPNEAFVTPQAMNRLRDRVRKSLRILTEGVAPVARIKSIDVTRPAAGRTQLVVKFDDLTTGLTDQTVEL